MAGNARLAASTRVPYTEHINVYIAASVKVSDRRKIGSAAEGKEATV